MRRHEELEFAVAELKLHNIKYDTRDTDGGHIEIAWQVSPDKEVRRAFTAKTPSDHRSRLNLRSYIRRALRQDGVNLDPKPSPSEKPALLEKALQTPKHVETIPDQLRAIRADMADMIDLLLDLSNAMAATKAREQADSVASVASAAPRIEEKPSIPKPSVRSKKALDHVSSSWNSLEAIAKSMDLPTDITYRKLYYLKQQDKIEFEGGQCRLKPSRPQLLRAQG